MGQERDLLFGVLAFQKGLIDADQLAATCAMDGAGLGTVADRLVGRECLTVEQRADLEREVDREVETCGGDPAATLAQSLDGRSLAVLGDVPGLAATLAAGATACHVPAAAGVAEGGRADANGNPYPMRYGSLGTQEEPESRDRYARSSLYAKGGMGQVWLAHDPSLGREIALKELRPDQSDNASVTSRFLAEARVTAQLEHPGIVPVYELGGGEVPYYTMRFIKGGTLSQATREYHKARAAGKADPLGLVKLLGAFVGVCHAIAYAHSRGFIHRDLKGQNVVLGDFGEVIVLDWGLAKKVGPDPLAAAPGRPEAAAPDEAPVVLPKPGTPTLADGPRNGHAGPNGQDHALTAAMLGDLTLPPDGDATHPPDGTVLQSGPGFHVLPGPVDVTQCGQILGTPAYMAPEQAEGRHEKTGRWTDVYGLGAILYEVLTGQPPFHAKTTSELLRKVRLDPPPPPRKIHAGVPPALEAVCLKAMAKDPAGRYGSATELAQEVQRYIADEPVDAYDEPWTRRAARWARKHRTAVAGAAGLLLTGTVALGISTVLIARERTEVVAKEKVARTAVNDMYVGFASNWLEDRLDPAQQETMEKALAFYENLTGQAAKDPAVRLEHGQAYQKMGEIHRKLGRFPEAEASFRKSLALLEPLAAAKDAGPDARRALAATRTRLGDLLFRDNRADEADTLFREAEGGMAPAVAAADPPADDRWTLARTLRSRGLLLRRKGDAKAARPALEKACSLLEQVAAALPKNPEARYDLAQASDYLGRVAYDLGDMAAYEKACRRAYTLLDELIAAAPTVPRYREAMSHACNDLGQVARAAGKPEECEVSWRRQLKEAERLAQDYPDRPEYRRLLAGGCSNLGGILAEQERFDEAGPILRRGIAENAALRKAFPDDREVSFDLGTCEYNLGYLQYHTGHPEEALATLDRARALEQALADREPATPRYPRLLAMISRCTGEALDALGRPGAEEAYRRSVGILEKLTAAHPDVIHFQIEYAQCLNRLADKQALARRNDDAEASFAKALAALDSAEAGGRGRAAGVALAARLEKAMTLSNRSVFRDDAGLPGAEASLRESIGIADKLAAEAPSPPHRQFLAIARNNLGEQLLKAGKPAEALDELKAAAGGLSALVAASPSSIKNRFYLGHVLDQQGQALARAGKPDEARRSLAEAVAQHKEVVKRTEGKLPEYRGELAASLGRLADASLAAGDYPAAIAAAADLARASAEPARGHLDAARLLARAAIQIQADGKLDAARKDELGRDCLGRTVVQLREALDLDPKLATSVESDPAIKDLLARPAFRTMFDSMIKIGLVR
ncbi:Serine/threonine-protein kinase PknD [Aquisphaera giovannonii]|uniref:Serine/threonine-protein kinase PknD n=1 Tax=Aquisphaera giovannonii TaxID=406548 RepID=A0A5B9VT14_9BACT|nr:protein kinase [Aquisphaera giovannonii]QEH31636.1 Serine/threonine-protein kinase PknD [Aquisphaera giovannonii]